jgi:hypothetical protein
MNILDKSPGLAAFCLLLYVFTCVSSAPVYFFALMFGVGTFHEYQGY